MQDPNYIVDDGKVVTWPEISLWTINKNWKEMKKTIKTTIKLIELLEKIAKAI